MQWFISILLLVASFQAQGFISISASPDMNEYMGSHFQLADGRSCFVFEDIPDFSRLQATLWRTCQNGGGAYQRPEHILATEAKNFLYIQNPRVISFRGRTLVYFNAYDENRDEGRWGRAEISDTTVGPIEWLTSPFSLEHQERAWIYLKVLSTGELLLTFEAFNLATRERELHFAISSDGLTFTSSSVVQTQAQMIRFEEFATGEWAFVYQVGYGANMMDFVRLSADRGKTFSAPLPVSLQANVHDPIFLRRKDGLLDVYYIVWHGTGFSLHRRKVNRDGSFGTEQQLTDATLDVQKPTASRLQNGDILVSLGQVKIDETGTPQADLIGLVIRGDAP